MPAAQIRPPRSAASGAVEAGVIEEARSRQRRRRGALSALALIAAAGALVAVAADGGGGPSAQPPHAGARAHGPAALAGAPLPATTPLRLVASENGGTVYVVDVARGSARRVRGLSPGTVSLSADGSSVLAEVTRWSCPACRGVATDLPVGQSDYLIAADGAARLIAKFPLGRHDYTAPAYGSTGTWVERWPRRGRCTLRLEPGGRGAVRAPCGNPGPATAQGLWLGDGALSMLVDPATGRVLRRRRRTDAAITVLPGGRALESPVGPTGLALVDLATGARRPLRWPGSPGFSGYRAIPSPDGRHVAVEFLDPFYPPAGAPIADQAADVWLLDTRTAAFSEIPGLPIREAIKFSGVAWTPRGQLVIVAAGDRGSATLGLWQPGWPTARVRTIPALHGYSQIVALRG